MQVQEPRRIGSRSRPEWRHMDVQNSLEYPRHSIIYYLQLIDPHLLYDVGRPTSHREVILQSSPNLPYQLQGE